MHGELAQRDIEDLAADVVEVDIDALRAMLAQRRAHVLVLVVDGRVEAEFVHQVAALVGAAGDADHAAALDPGHLPDHHPDRASGTGHHHGVAFLRGADVEQAEICGHAGHPEHAQVGGQRGEPGVDQARALAVGDHVLLHAEHAGHAAADREFRVVRRNHFTRRIGAHHLADADRRHVGLALVHPAAHRRIQRDVFDADQEFAFAGIADGFFDQVPVAGLGQADGTRGEAELAVGDGVHASSWTEMKPNPRRATALNTVIFCTRTR